MGRPMGFEPTTFCATSRRSRPTELRPPYNPLIHFYSDVLNDDSYGTAKSSLKLNCSACFCLYGGLLRFFCLRFYILHKSLECLLVLEHHGMSMYRPSSSHGFYPHKLNCAKSSDTIYYRKTDRSLIFFDPAGFYTIVYRKPGKEIDCRFFGPLRSILLSNIYQSRSFDGSV